MPTPEEIRAQTLGYFGAGTSTRRTQPATDTGDSGFSPLGWATGFAGNVLGDVGEMVTGLSGIVSGLGSDAIKLATGNPHDLFTPRFLSEAPGAILGDYAHRYGSGFAKGLYEDPLMYLFDALGVGGLAGKAAELPALAGSAFAEKVLPKTKLVLQNPDVTSTLADVVPVVDHANPVSRFLLQTIPSKVGFKGYDQPLQSRFLPVQNLQEQVGKLEAMKDVGLSSDETVQLAKMKHALNLAQERGVVTYEAPRYARRAIKRAATKITSAGITKLQGMRAFHEGEIAKALEPLMKHAEGVADRIPTAMIGLDNLGMDAFSPDKFISQLQSKGFQSLDHAMQAVAQGAPEAAMLHPDEIAVLNRVQPNPFKPVPNLGWDRAMRPIAVKDLGNPAPAVQPTQDLFSLQKSAEANKTPFLDRGRTVYGPNFFVRAKGLERTVGKFAADGEVPTDILGGRVILADASQAEAEMAKLPWQVVSVKDTRALPLGTGHRSLAATVHLDDGTLAEVEFGTPVWAKTRDVSTTTEHLIERMQTERASIIQQLENPTEGINVQALQERAAQLDEAILKSTLDVRSLWTRAADEMDAQLNGKVMPGAEIRDAFEDLRLYVYGAFTKPMIDSGVFDPAKAFDRSYLAKRMEAGAEWDAKTKTLQGPEGSDALTLHAERLAQDLPAPIYYPFYNVNEIGPADLLTSTRNLRGGLKKMENPSFLKQATGSVLKNGKLLMDPKEALMRRAVEMIRLQEGVDLYHNMLNTFGRPVFGSEMVDSRFEVLTSPHGVLNFFNGKLGLTDKVLAKLIEHTNLSDTDLEAIITEVMPATQRDILAVTRQGVQQWAVPRVVAQQWERQFIIPSAESGFRMFWDTPVRVWRSLVLTGRPAWVVNNTIGNAFFIAMQPGARLSNVLRQLDEPFMHKLGKVLNNPEMQQYQGFRTAIQEAIPEEMRSRVATGGMYTAEAGGEAAMHLGSARYDYPSTAKFYDQASETWHSQKVLKRVHSLGQHIRAINASVEDAFRTASFVGEAEKTLAKANAGNVFRQFWTTKEDLRQIAQHGINPENAEKMLDTANYFHNDYNNLGPVERHVVRRFIAPFYSFYKHVVRLALKYPFDYGARTLVAANLSRFVEEMDRELYGNVPPWLRGATPLGDPSTAQAWLGGAPGNPFSTLLGLTEFSGFGMLAPPVKIIAEQQMGRSTLTGRQFTDANVVTPFGTDQGYRVIRDGDGRVIDTLPTGPGQPGGKVAPGLLEHLLQQIPQYTLLKNAIAGGKTYDTESLLSVMGGQGAARGYTGTTLPVSLPQAVGRFVGIPTYDFDLGKYQSNLQQGSTDAAKLWYRSRGAPTTATVGAAPPGDPDSVRAATLRFFE